MIAESDVLKRWNRRIRGRVGCEIPRTVDSEVGQRAAFEDIIICKQITFSLAIKPSVVRNDCAVCHRGTRQVRTLCKRLIIQALQRAWEGNGRNARSSESPLSDYSDTLWESNRGQACALIESLSFNFFQCKGKIDAGDRSAFEGFIFDFRHRNICLGSVGHVLRNSYRTSVDTRCWLLHFGITRRSRTAWVVIDVIIDSIYHRIICPRHTRHEQHHE